MGGSNAQTQQTAGRTWLCKAGQIGAEHHSETIPLKESQRISKVKFSLVVGPSLRKTRGQTSERQDNTVMGQAKGKTVP
jgi:hypothetical protein